MTDRDTRPSWDEYFMHMAQMVQKRSTCVRRHVGVVITSGRTVVATGYNGAPTGEPHCTDVGCLHHGDSPRCRRSVHAEINALLRLPGPFPARSVTVYTTTSPCYDCTSALLNVPCIGAVVFNDRYDNDDDNEALVRLERAGIAVRRVPVRHLETRLADERGIHDVGILEVRNV